MKERSTRGATHSFRLSARACDYVENLADGRSKWKKGKSQWVSTAIVWFFSSPIYGQEYDDQGERTGKLIRSGTGMPVPVAMFDEIERLEAELAALKEQSDPPSRGWKGLFSWLRP